MSFLIRIGFRISTSGWYIGKSYPLPSIPVCIVLFSALSQPFSSGQLQKTGMPWRRAHKLESKTKIWKLLRSCYRSRRSGSDKIGWGNGRVKTGKREMPPSEHSISFTICHITRGERSQAGLERLFSEPQQA